MLLLCNVSDANLSVVHGVLCNVMFEMLCFVLLQWSMAGTINGKQKSVCLGIFV